MPSFFCGRSVGSSPNAKTGYARRRKLTVESLEGRRVLASVALLSADFDYQTADVVASLTANRNFDSVVPIDVALTNPTLATLQAYDSVLVWSNFPFFDPTALGNLLADYVDSGRGVAVAWAADTTYTPSHGLQGRWLAEGYAPFNTGATYTLPNASIGTIFQPEHPVLAGVSSFDLGPGFGLGGYAAQVTLTAGALPIADLTSGIPLAAEQTGHAGKIVGLNFFPPSSAANEYSWTATTHGGKLLANTVYYVGNHAPSIAADELELHATEGSVVSNTGVFADSYGNSTVTISASVGTVVKNDAAGTWSWSLSTSDDLSGTTTVVVSATDDLGVITQTTFTYSVENVAPTLTIGGPSHVNEGSPYSLMLGPVNDPGTDTVVSYIVHWGDATSAVYSSGGTKTHVYADGSHSYAVSVELVDEDGTFPNQANAHTITVDNVAPTATPNSYTTTQATMLSGNVITDDVSDADPAGANDPLSSSVHTLPSNGVLELRPDGSFTYTPDSTFSGIDSFEYLLSDGDGGVSVATVSIDVLPAAPGSVLIIDDTCLEGTALLVTGTAAGDMIVVVPGSTDSTLKVSVNGVSRVVARPTGRIIVIGGGGDDNIQVAGAISNPAWLYGDDGNDRLNAGNGGSLLIGGAGCDLLLGGAGRDIMIGGEGSDQIIGNSADDILVAGYTTQDARTSLNHEEYWCEVTKAWNAAIGFQQRVANLKPQLEPKVVDDAMADACDFLNGSAGSDWILFASHEDKVAGKAEAITVIGSSCP